MGLKTSGYRHHLEGVGFHARTTLLDVHDLLPLSQP
jgi:hypothetical protein